jgi:RNA polymerase sigma-70 factor (ECF subfamily)
MRPEFDRHAAETRFRTVFAHLGAVTAYARRRGSKDADAIAAEVMTIAWRRLGDVPRDDPRPWLYATARNLVFEEARRRRRYPSAVSAEDIVAAPEVEELDPQLHAALLGLSTRDREALLLIAWEDLSPSLAAKTLGVNPAAFRVRLLRARRRLRALLDDPAADASHVAPALDVEGT